MNIVHVTSWLSRNGGGIPPVIWALARESNRSGIKTSVVGLMDEWVKDDCKNGDVEFAAGQIIGPKALGFSPELKKQLEARAESKGIIHTHGLWMYPGWAARKCAAKINSRLVISPHGMLEPWALNHSTWKKKLAEHLFESGNFHKADCIHALCEAEAVNFRRYGLKNPIAIIPNGVDFEEFQGHPGDAMVEKFPELKGRKQILFLARLHSKKGLGNLLEAWKKMAADFSNWQLLIAGSGEPAYMEELKNQARDLIFSKSVVFTGPLYGESKKQILAASDVFVLPSFSEGFSVAILEAAASGLPVVLTPECNFPELARANAAIEIPTAVDGIEKGLRQILTLPDEERQAMGRRGQELIKRFYTWPAIADQMRLVYDWLAGTAALPATVKLL